MSLNNISWRNFVHNVIWLRKRNKLSTEEMAKIMKIDVALLEEVENGNCGNIIEVDVIYEIYDYFNVRPDELMCKRLDENI